MFRSWFAGFLCNLFGKRKQKGNYCVTSTDIFQTSLPLYAYTLGHAVAQVVEALCYEPKGSGFDFWYHFVLNLPNPSIRSRALGLILPLTEMSTRNLTGGKGRPESEADNFAVCEPPVLKMWKPRRLTTIWASRACYRDSFLCLYITIRTL
jgi:hypothetical protein